ncbi:unnamed protein product [Spodoptera littoralis]|uniref:Uncharacterized protein n=1 Tax=Spodoptera littoralis TaxID=7109 RepID=A0A9P0MYR1_SPOLI|nr:unnamed protein product [Spodoptera littoralis]CAH1635268.1 unnamed protein product [Spodoptera littoralis]
MKDDKISEPVIFAQDFDLEKQIEHLKILEVLKHEFEKKLHINTFCKKSVIDFDIIKTIGEGTFSVVYLVRDTDNFEYHAMKAVDKRLIIQKQCVKHLYTEKNILQSIKFPFLMTLNYGFKDNVYVYFLLPYQPGGEMFSLLKKFGCISEDLMKFYAAQLVLALEYLHYCSVIHRNVKPENIVISANGYIKLIDFGFAKIIKSRTWTICGTPEYLAPEMILSKGYSFPVDWWALGVLIYEMCAGYPPFCSGDPITLYEKIVEGRFKTPPTMSNECKFLLKHLLQVDPTARLCSNLSKVYEIKTNVWFSDIKWRALLLNKTVPPYKPEVKNPGDTSNFRDFPEKLLVSSPDCLYPDEFEDF